MSREQRYLAAIVSADADLDPGYAEALSCLARACFNPHCDRAARFAPSPTARPLAHSKYAELRSYFSREIKDIPEAY